jgi:hypothetical protein
MSTYLRTEGVDGSEEQSEKHSLLLLLLASPSENAKFNSPENAKFNSLENGR